MIYFTVVQMKHMVEGLPDDAVIGIKPVFGHANVVRLEAHDSGVTQSAALAYDIARTIGKQEIK